MKLQDIKAEFAKYFVIADPWILHIILGTLIGNMIVERDPLWTMIVGKSSGGKTTLLAPAESLPNTYFIDDLTEKTLLSGFKVAGKETSLLRKIGSGMMIFSDFTSILMKNPVTRGEILTQLKLVYDGKLTKQTGTGSMSWSGKIGGLCATTPDVYAFLESGRSMGERFLYYWLDQPTDEAIMAKQAEVQLSSREITEALKPMYADYFEGVKKFYNRTPIELSISEDQKNRIRAASLMCVMGKATIRTDFKSGKPDAIPNVSGVGRDNKIFDTLLHALQLMAAYEVGDRRVTVTDEMVRIIEKCAYSSINRERRKILEILVDQRGSMTSSEIGARPGLGLEKASVEKYLAPMHSVGMIKKSTRSNAFSWYIDDQNVIGFVERVAGTVVDDTHVEPIDISAQEAESNPNWAEEFMNGPDRQ